MKALKVCRQAFRTLRRYGLRTLLMMLGIFIGIASIAVLSSLGEATRRDTMQRFKNMLGTFDVIIVRPGGGRTRGMPTLVNVPPTLRFDDADAILHDASDISAIAEVQNAFDIDVKYRDRTSSPAIFGVSPNWLQLRGEGVADGSFFTPDQNTSLARVAVLGPDARDQMFPGERPIGKTIRIADVPFEVIGLLKSRGAGPAGASLDDVILIPVNTAARRLFNRDYLTMLLAQVKNPERSDEATAQVANLLRKRHQIRTNVLDDFTITNPSVTVAQVNRAGNTLTKILTGVSALALLIGGIVIMSLMSIAVSERCKEIGVRRALGASRSDILQQFCFEAVFVSFAGGVSGVLIGLGALQLLTRIEKLPPVLLWQPVAAAVALSLAIGVLFGLYPAWRAANLAPTQALRS